MRSSTGTRSRRHDLQRVTDTFKGAEIAGVQALGSASKYSGHIFELIENAPLFSKITRDEAKLLSNAMQVYRAQAGTPFIAEGDPGDFLVLVLDGEVEVIKGHQAADAKLIATVGRGKTLGEMSMIDGEPRFATCVASSVATFAVLSREHLLRIIEERPALGAKILMQMVVLISQRLRTASEKLVVALQ